ncbi:hypothetical protein BHU72_02170 [Desulfuribacillus stibiiarsenatis]|uniref:Chemotaxis protein CheA n=1 Tax=Desulfuribacillus stibiiarsenatis TaxID=1390249 RepID=A0A1E5L691_9FIRM|nr:chemotaxis protein CheA [Desulfuribacillus stibiiarsenatis]OEH85626.1 hypothetical protein BHU72_02170 [Desulfuribacillus stibiiarsenatis]
MSEDLLELFLEETRENIQVVEEGLLELEEFPDNDDLMNKVFRAMHTVKGGAGLVGLDVINNISHQLENLLDAVRRGDLQLNPDMIGVLLSGCDLLKQIMDQGDFVATSFQCDIDSLYARLKIFQIVKAEVKPAGVAAQSRKKSSKNIVKVKLKFREDIFETGTDPIMLILELEEVGTILESYCNITKIPDMQEFDPHALYTYWTIIIETEESIDDVDNIFIFVKEENDISVEDITDEYANWTEEEKRTGELLIERGLISQEDIEDALRKQKKIGELLVEEGKISKGQIEQVVSKQQVAKSQEQTNTIRVDTTKLEKILNQLAELLIAQSRVKELVLANQIRQTDPTKEIARNGNVIREIASAFDEVDTIIRVVQEEVMNTTMVPIGGTFTRFQRMIRDLAKDIGKEVKLVVEGKETELDKKVIEQIADPLKHLIRNALDHGLEFPDEREKKGKNREGTIELKASHQEGSIVIEISDDGKGIDEKVIFAKAVERKLIKEDAQLTKNEMYQLLFKPGFTTAKEITDISGRGVGLDVVITNIKQLRGTVEMDSELGKGTKTKIKLPLTLAIIDGMMVRVGDERYIIPLNMITEFIKADEKQIYKAEGKGIFIQLREEYLPFAGLYQLLHLESECKHPTEGILVVLQNNQRKLALMVDEIVGQEQVVIKSMKDNMQQIEGVAGVTILGNGKVAIILDVPSIFKLVKKTASERANMGEPVWQ